MLQAGTIRLYAQMGRGRDGRLYPDTQHRVRLDWDIVVTFTCFRWVRYVRGFRFLFSEFINAECLLFMPHRRGSGLQAGDAAFADQAA